MELKIKGLLIGFSEKQFEKNLARWVQVLYKGSLISLLLDANCDISTLEFSLSSFTPYDVEVFFDLKSGQYMKPLVIVSKIVKV